MQPNRQQSAAAATTADDLSTESAPPLRRARPRQFAAVRAEPETRDEEPGHSAHVLSDGFYSPISYCERLIESRQAEPLPRHDFVVRF